MNRGFMSELALIAKLARERGGTCALTSHDIEEARRKLDNMPACPPHPFDQVNTSCGRKKTKWEMTPEESFRARHGQKSVQEIRRRKKAKAGRKAARRNR